MLNQCHIGDCRELLKQFAVAGVRAQMCVTSPPYFGLRDYGHPGQLGLEPTPSAYVEQLVAVFAAVRDVLTDDGTLWLNLGDSYNNRAKVRTSSHQPALNKFVDDNWAERAARGGVRMSINDGTIKEKDLLGIPWRVAFALQAPYYAGKIFRELDRVWLAAMVDGEGCFYVHRRQAGGHAGDGYYRKADTYSPAFEVANTHKAIVDRCLEITGVGSVIRQEKDRRQPLWRWTVRSSEAKEVAREIYPHLVGKQQQCRIICGMPAHGERAVAAWEAMKILHAGGTTDVDFNPPASLHQPGWYLRSDIIWSKPNPMPESVTDRPTKAHEYLFLLAKSERYYYDAEAIAERELQPVGEPKLTGQVKRAAGTENGPRYQSDLRSSILGSNQGSETRNKRSVWTVNTQAFEGAHFATFPRALIEPCILAGSRKGDVVLDPFMGSGTTAQVAEHLGRQWIGCEINPDYMPLQAQRLAQRAMAF